MKLEQKSRESPTLELTVLMPCLNEAETIETCVAKARKLLTSEGINGEVLVADNGSTDGSQELARMAGARVVDVHARGYGAALMGGILAARGSYIIMGDADDSYDFTNLHGFVDRLRAGADIVMGNRFKGDIKPNAMPFLHKYLGNPALSFLGRLFFRIPIGDFHCGLRGFSRDAILRLGLVCPGMEFASEMIVKGSLAGLRFEEVPTTLSPAGRSRPPHLRTWRDGWRHLRFLLLHSPKWLFFYPGIALLILGLGGIIALLPGPLRVTPNTILDTHSLLASSFAVLIGTQFVSFFILARRYARNEGLLPAIRRFPNLIESLDLERVLQISLLLFIAGSAGFGWAIWRWASNDFGPIFYSGVMRTLIVSLTGVAVAVQLAATAFLASIFSLRHPQSTRIDSQA